MDVEIGGKSMSKIERQAKAMSQFTNSAHPAGDAALSVEEGVALEREKDLEKTPYHVDTETVEELDPAWQPKPISSRRVFIRGNDLFTKEEAETKDLGDLGKPTVQSMDKMDKFFAEQDMFEQVNHPDHYNVTNMETIDVIKGALTDDQFQGYLQGNIIKYVSRYRYKGMAVKDLQKAEWYLKKLQVVVGGEEPSEAATLMSEHSKL